MTNKSSDSLLLVLSKGTRAGRLAVDLQSFLEFNAQMDHQLRSLVKRWEHMAAPRSKQPVSVLRRGLIRQ